MLGNTNANNKIDLSILSEKINITLKTNQETNDDLIGVVVTLSYGSYSENIRWEGTRLTFSVITGISYTISFSEVEGYKTPDSLTFDAIANNVSQIEAEYQTEIVTVTVSTDSGASISGQILTINNVAIPLSDSNIITQKIPYGTEYSISVNNLEGYIAPINRQFTAEQPSRLVEMEYEEILFGIFIQDITGKLWKSSQWDNSETPNGIAVITENCEFVMGLEYLNLAIGDEEDRATLPIFATVEEAITDFNGISNTDMLIECYKDTRYGPYAAYYCKEYIFPNGKNGYLGAAGEWNAIHNNLAEVNNCLSVIKPFQDWGIFDNEIQSYIWTSTRGSSTNNYDMFWSYSNNSSEIFNASNAHYSLELSYYPFTTL